MAASRVNRGNEHHLPSRMAPKLMSLYGLYGGIALLLLGAVGLATGAVPLLGLNSDPLEDLLHILLGSVLGAVILTEQRPGIIRAVMGGIGIVLVALGIAGLLSPNLGGVLPHGYSVWDTVFHLFIGLIAIGLAWVFGRKRPPAAPHPGLA